MPPPTRLAAVTRLAEGYWAESRRPLASLVFIAPLLVVYEVGVRLLGSEAARNGADVWMRRVLEWMQFDQYFLLPVLTVCILLGWHYTTRQSWRFSRGVLWGMAVESLLLALVLRFVLHVQAILWGVLARPAGHDAAQPALTLDISGTAGRLVGFLGAGVYEELLFRLILLSLAVWMFQRLGLRGGLGVAVPALATSLAFATAHYVGPYGEAVAWLDMSFWFGFFFRFLAGLFFSALFLYRGFGIAAGCHAGYDILVGLC
jgi:hypothetical protein